MIVPRRTPPISRRPKNTTVTLPVSSASVHSSAGLPPHGWTRNARTRPATVDRSRDARSAIRVRPLGRSFAETLVAAGPVLTGFDTPGPMVGTGAGTGSPPDRLRPRWYGTIVTLQCGVSPSAATIEFDDRS